MTQVKGLARPLHKSAGGPPAAIDPVDAEIRSQALKDILTVGGLAAAGGIGARGLLGLRYMFGRRRPDLSRAIGPTVISIPTPVFKNPRDEVRARGLAKAANAPLSGRTGLPWYLPGLTLAGVGGLAGGYRLMDVLMDKKRKADLEAEILAAKDDYHRALLDQYDPAMVPSADTMPDEPLPAKTVNAPAGAAKLRLKSAELQTDLDALANQVEKVGAEKAAMPNWANKGLGVYGTIAALLALGSGTAAYNYTKKRSTNRLLEDSLRQRERDRWSRRPPELYAIPTPVKLTRGGDLAPTGKAPVLPGTEGI